MWTFFLNILVQMHTLINTEQILSLNIKYSQTVLSSHSTANNGNLCPQWQSIFTNETATNKVPMKQHVLSLTHAFINMHSWTVTYMDAYIQTQKLLNTKTSWKKNCENHHCMIPTGRFFKDL